MSGVQAGAVGSACLVVAARYCVDMRQYLDTASAEIASKTGMVVMQGCFPEPDKDPVIQIASMVTNQGETSPVVRNVMTLDTCAAIIGSEVMSFSTEEELLKVSMLEEQVEILVYLA